MKINSAFSKGAFCPSCKKYVIGQQGQPDHAWPCIYCPEKICAWCFSSHTEEKHPEAYSVDIEVTYLVGDKEIGKGVINGIPYAPTFLSPTIHSDEASASGEMKFDGDSYTVVKASGVTPV